MTVKFSAHAKARMQERNITAGDVFRVLAYGTPAPSRGCPVWKADRTRLPQELSALKSIYVVCRELTSTRQLLIVTTYRASDQQTSC